MYMVSYPIYTYRIDGSNHIDTDTKCYRHWHAKQRRCNRKRAKCVKRRLPFIACRIAHANSPDGVGNGLGYALILVIVGAVREFLGRGSLLGFQLIPEGAYNFGYVNNGMMTMPAMALILVGCVIWVHRAYICKEEE